MQRQLRAAGSNVPTSRRADVPTSRWPGEREAQHKIEAARRSIAETDAAREREAEQYRAMQAQENAAATAATAGDAGGACQEYRINLLAARTGECICGNAKLQHSEAALRPKRVSLGAKRAAEARAAAEERERGHREEQRLLHEIRRQLEERSIAGAFAASTVAGPIAGASLHREPRRSSAHRAT